MEVINQFSFVELHNSFYIILAIVSVLVIIAFATIFIKNYKEYKATVSSTYSYKKNPSLSQPISTQVSAPK